MTINNLNQCTQTTALSAYANGNFISVCIYTNMLKLRLFGGGYEKDQVYFTALTKTNGLQSSVVSSFLQPWRLNQETNVHDLHLGLAAALGEAIVLICRLTGFLASGSDLLVPITCRQKAKSASLI